MFELLNMVYLFLLFDPYLLHLQTDLLQGVYIFLDALKLRVPQNLRIAWILWKLISCLFFLFAFLCFLQVQMVDRLAWKASLVSKYACIVSDWLDASCSRFRPFAILNFAFTLRSFILTFLASTPLCATSISALFCYSSVHCYFNVSYSNF